MAGEYESAILTYLVVIINVVANIHLLTQNKALTSNLPVHYAIDTTLCFTARSSYASAVLRIVILSDRLSVPPSVCLSVTRVLCDETKNYTAEILIPHEKVIRLVF